MSPTNESNFIFCILGSEKVAQSPAMTAAVDGDGGNECGGVSIVKGAEVPPVIQTAELEIDPVAAFASGDVERI